MNSGDYSQLRSRSVDSIRQAIRRNEYRGHTAGLAPGFLQANVVILPESYALDFMRYCQRNPKPCPLVGVSETGDPILRTLGAEIDIRTDVPSYCVYREGELSETLPDIKALWSDDMVAFALGCSFTFENALIEAGIPIWHIDNDRTVPMYRSGIMTVAAGGFGGEMVVTMRAIDAERVDDASRISRRFPLAHGGPVHIGDPLAIGIADLQLPDWGDVPPPVGNQVPVFWACGVTPQQALMHARLPVSISHQPGRMLITDIDEQAEVPILQDASKLSIRDAMSSKA
ncbi:MAG: putative hydro-lyase [Granulosicoccus sp.]|nr:putative hydro-lyase [Granulosicoccus sp.]